jgi:hypothetical protein
MYYKNIIEMKLKELEGGRFQLLCNDLLEHLGYGAVTNSGGQTGTEKTIVGTPDAYIMLEDGKFVFVEYTTQQNAVCKKFIADIEKCFDKNKTKVSTERIDKIIIMFNSNLSAGEVGQLFKVCQDERVQFEKFDINDIVYYITNRFPFLAKDYLGVNIDSGQFLNYTSFIKMNDHSMLSTPLGLEIIGRESSILDIHRMIDSSNFVIVSGKTGIGKTKLVCDALNRYAEINGKIGIWFIKDKGQGLYEELLRYVNVGQHLIFIDDINKQTHIDELLSFVDENRDRIKVISTVREYALQSTVDRVGKYLVPQIYNVDVLSDRDLVEILEKNFEILNSDYQKQIVRLSNGNVRLAVMMAIVAKKENTLSSILSIGDILEKYYDFIKNRLESITDVNILKSLGALSFIDKLHIDSAESMDIVSKITNIEKKELVNLFMNLHYDEIVDLFENEVVTISEQIVSVFIFNYVFKVRGILDYTVVLEAFFPDQKNKIVQNVNAVVSYYGNIDFFCDAVRKVWNEWEKSNDDKFRELALTFWFVKPEDTLIYVLSELDKRPCNLRLAEAYEVDNNTEYDQFLSTLGQFSNDINHQVALEVILDYLARDYSQISSISKMLIDCYGYNIYSYKQGYKIQKSLINAIVNRLSESEVFVQLFVNISIHLLSFEIEWTESANNKSINFYTIPLFNFGEMESIRTTIWEQFNQLINDRKYLKYIKRLLTGIGNNRRSSEDKTLYELEFTLMNSSMLSLVEFDDLELYSILFKVECIYRQKLKKRFIALDRIESKAYQVYKLFKETPYDYSDDWEDGEMQLKDKQIEFAKKLNPTDFTDFMECCKQIMILDDGYENSEIIARILLNTSAFTDLLSAFLIADTPFKAHPSNIINRLVDEIGYEESYEFIMKHDFSTKEYWIYLLFSLVNNETASEKIYNDIFFYFHNCENVSMGYIRNLDFLEHFKKFNNKIVSEIVKLIFYKSDVFFKRLYLHSLFMDEEKLDKLISNFENEVNVLEDIYLFLFEQNEIFDLNGLICRRFISLRPDLLYKLVDIICEKESSSHYGNKVHFDFSIIWEKEVHEILRLIDYIIERYIKYSLDSKLEPFLLGAKKDDHKEKIHLVIDELINEYSDNKKKMSLVFYIVAYFNDDERVGHFLKFIEVNPDVDAFQCLPFNKSMESWSGSEVPILISKKSFIELLLSRLTNAKLLKHRAYLKRVIENYNEIIEKTRINEFLRDY